MDPADPAPRRSALIWALAVFLGGLALTASLTIPLLEGARENARLRFEAHARRVEDHLAQRVEVIVALLRGTAGFFAAGGPTDEAAFARHVARLRLDRMYPGVLGVGYSRDFGAKPPTSAEIAQLRGDDAASVVPWPTTRRERYHAIVFIEPQHLRNRAALGYDMHSEPVRAQAMDLARDSGSAAISGRVTLVQELAGPPQAGFLIYVPVYAGGLVPRSLETRRARFLGVAYAPLRAGDFFAPTAAETVPPGLSVALHDGASLAPTHRLHVFGQPSAEPAHERIGRLELHGRVWTVHTTATPDPSFLAERRSVIASALAGIALSGIMAWGVLIQARARAGAERAQARRAADQRRIEHLLSREVERGQRLRQLSEATLTLHASRDVADLLAALSHEARRLAPEALADVRRIDDDDAIDPDRTWPLGGEHGNRLALRSAGALDPESTDTLAQLAATARLALRNLQLLDQLAERDRRKDEFLATLAHELRNPLAAVVNALAVIERSADSNRRETALGIAQRQGRQLVRLVDDLLDVARITRGSIRLLDESLDLREVLTQAAETAQPVIEGKAHRLTLSLPDSPLPLRGDRARLTQVFGNLLANAARYTEPGGEIAIEAKASAASVRVHVRDTGTGIAADRLERIFEPFYQVGPGGTEGGLGIGLTLVRRLVELHGGRVRAESGGAQRGSVFVVELPLAPA